MNESPPQDDRQRELLTAYLDGELPDDELAAVEDRLATDAQLREQMQSLERAWNALDGLPRIQAGNDFTKTTIEMVAVEAKKEVAAATAAVPAVRRRRGTAIAGAAAAALLIGFLIGRSLATRTDRQLVENLPVIYRVDALQEVSSNDFLRKLPETAPNLLRLADGEQVQQRAADWRLLADGDRRARAGWVSGLDEGEKAKLLDAAERYRTGLSPERREAAREAFAAIHAADDRDTLMLTTLRYEAWLASRPASEQLRLRQMDDQQRLKELRGIDRRVAAVAATTLSIDDTIALREATQSLAGAPEIKAMRAALDEAIDAGIRDREDLSKDDAARARVFLSRLIESQYRYPVVAVQHIAFVADGKAMEASRRAPKFIQRLLTMEPQVRADLQKTAEESWSGIERKLLAALSEEARENIARDAKPSEQRRRLAKLVIQASRNKRGSVDLEEFFASDALSDADRYRLLALPTEEMEATLKRMYAERIGGGERIETPPWMRGDRRERGGRGFEGGVGPGRGRGGAPRSRPQRVGADE